MTNADSDKDDKIQFSVTGHDWPSSSVNAGGTQIQLVYNSCDTPASYVSGGGGIFFGMNRNDGDTDSWAWFDKDALWLIAHPIKPYFDASNEDYTNLGDATHRFNYVYVNRLNNNDAVVKVTTGIQIEDNAGTPVVYGYVDTNSGYFNFRSYNNRNILIDAGTGTAFFDSDASPLTDKSANLGSSTKSWEYLYATKILIDNDSNGRLQIPVGTNLY